MSVKRVISGSLMAVGLIFGGMPMSHAILLPAGLDVTGQSIFDDGLSFNGTGDISIVSGMATTTTTFDESNTLGGAATNPVDGTVSDIDDGVGFTASASATAENLEPDEFLVGLDANLTATNNSAGDIFDIVFRLVFSNNVNTTGTDDSYAISEMSLFDGTDEIAFSYLWSDTFFGNFDEGLVFGGSLSDSDDLTFNYILNPTESISLDLSWTLEGGDYEGDLASGSLSAFLSIDSVDVRPVEPPTPGVPVPGTGLLLGLGLGLLGAVQHKRRRGTVIVAVRNHQ